MNPYFRLAHCVGLFITPLLTAWLFVGCASTPKVDWNTRVGNYTYDQAVAELGPPDKSTKLSDGTTVADWITRRSSGVSFGLGTGYSHYGGSVGTSTGVGVGMPIGSIGDHVLRLIYLAPKENLRNGTNPKREWVVGELGCVERIWLIQ